MRVRRKLTGALVTLATVGMLLPPATFGAGPLGATPQGAIRDVALQDGGVLQGQVLDQQGSPASGVPVALVRQSKVVATAKTDGAGRFAVKGLKAGIYQLATAQGAATYRLWAPRTAPPAATAQALIVNTRPVVRGRMGGGGLVGFLSNPWVLGGIVAAAIAIPLAVENNEGS